MTKNKTVSVEAALAELRSLKNREVSDLYENMFRMSEDNEPSSFEIGVFSEK